MDYVKAFTEDFSELGQYLYEPVKRYSAGMKARLAFALSLAVEFDCYLIDEVIAVIRESDEPKQDLMARFHLSDIQAEDILEIRLRQLARLEGIKLEQELSKLQEERQELQHILGDENVKRKLIINELKADTQQFGDECRSLI